MENERKYFLGFIETKDTVVFMQLNDDKCFTFLDMYNTKIAILDYSNKNIDAFKDVNPEFKDCISQLQSLFLERIENIKKRRSTTNTNVNNSNISMNSVSSNSSYYNDIASYILKNFPKIHDNYTPNQLAARLESELKAIYPRRLSILDIVGKLNFECKKNGDTELEK